MDELKRHNDELRSRVHELKVDSDSVENKEEDAMNKFQDEDIIDSKKTISSQQTEFSRLLEKYKKINIVND